MTKEDLQRFCSDDDYRKDAVGVPWSEGDWTYATDGRLLLRVPRLPDVPENEKAPKNIDKNIFDLNPITGNWQKIPSPLPAFGDGEKCDECKGSGQHECRCGDQHDCGKCEGSGSLPSKSIAVEIGCHHVAHIYLHKIRDIPGIEICQSATSKAYALGLRFDGGDGRLMGMRVD